LAALVALNLGLKLSWTGVNELAGDEPFTVYWALRPLHELFSMLHTENNPPLYFLLLHGWLKYVPLDPAWMRIPSALFSALTVWPLFLLARRLGGIAMALTASLLFTFSQHSFGFAHEVRAYSLLVLACTWALWQLVRLGEDPLRMPSLRAPSVLWLVVANTVATWAHYFGWLVVGLELVLVFIVPILRVARVKTLVAAGLTVLLNLPLLGILRERAGISLGQGTWVAPPGWDEPYNMVMRWCNAPVVAVAFLAVITWALIRVRARRSPFAIGLWWCAIPLIGMFLVSFFFPVYIDRYLLFASIGFYLLVSGALASLGGPQALRHALMAAAIGGMLFTFRPWAENGLHPSKVARQTEAWCTDGCAVVIQPAWYDLTYAWARNPDLFTGVAPMGIALRERGVYPLEGNQPPALDSSITTVIHIDAWAALTDPEGRVLGSLRQQFVQTDSVEADRKVMMRLFSRPDR
jgi:hypothetical protein